LATSRDISPYKEIGKGERPRGDAPERLKSQLVNWCPL